MLVHGLVAAIRQRIDAELRRIWNASSVSRQSSQRASRKGSARDARDETTT
jgi:hypothetical protein